MPFDAEEFRKSRRMMSDREYAFVRQATDWIVDHWYKRYRVEPKIGFVNIWLHPEAASLRFMTGDTTHPDTRGGRRTFLGITVDYAVKRPPHIDMGPPFGLKEAQEFADLFMLEPEELRVWPSAQVPSIPMRWAFGAGEPEHYRPSLKPRLVIAVEGYSVPRAVTVDVTEPR